MTIPYIPAIDPTVGANLAQIAEAVGDTLNPNLKFETAFKNALATNPQLVQQIGNLNARNPDAIRTLYGNNVAEYFNSSVAQAPEDRASVARADLNTRLDTSTAQGIEALPEPVRQQAQQAGAFAAISGGRSEGQVQLDNLQTQSLNAWNAYTREHSNLPPQTLVDRIRSGDPNIPAEVAQGAFYHPLYARLLRDAEEKEQREYQERIYNTRTSNDLRKSEDQNIRMAARQLMIQAHSSDLPSWEEIVRNGPTSVDIQKAREKPIESRTAKEQGLVAAADAYSRLNRQDRIRAMTPTYDQIRLNRDKIPGILRDTKLGTEEKINALGGIAAALNTHYREAQIPIHVTVPPYSDGGWFGRETKPALTYTFIGQDGKEVPITEAQADQMFNQAEIGVTAPGETRSANPKVNAAIEAIRNGTAKLTDVESATQYTAEEKAQIRAAFATGS